MQTDVAFEKMEKLLPYVSAVINDAELSALMQEIRRKQGSQKAGNAMDSLLPIFIAKHRDEMWNIVAILSDKSVEEVKEQEFGVTLDVMRKCFLDEMLVFFHYCLRMARSV